jgi:hypothetical protein
MTSYPDLAAHTPIDFPIFPAPMVASVMMCSFQDS